MFGLSEALLQGLIQQGQADPAKLQEALDLITTHKAGLKADIIGRPKHIYSNWNKMRAKSLDFSEVYYLRALREASG